MTTTKRIRVYELFPNGVSISCKTENYSGTVMAVAAGSIRQAYACAYNDSWINPKHRYPVGIISVHGRDQRPVLWCGCEGYGPSHGAGITALRNMIDAHNRRCPKDRPWLDPAWRKQLEKPKPKGADRQPEMLFEGDM